MPTRESFAGSRRYQGGRPSPFVDSVGASDDGLLNEGRCWCQVNCSVEEPEHARHHDLPTR